MGREERTRTPTRHLAGVPPVKFSSRQMSFVAIAFVSLGSGSPNQPAFHLSKSTDASCCAELLAMASCTGSASCRACTNCSRCAHCKRGGSCGVCARPSRTPSAPPPTFPPESSRSMPTAKSDREDASYNRAAIRADAQQKLRDQATLTAPQWVSEMGKLGEANVETKEIDPRLLVHPTFKPEVGVEASIFGVDKDRIARPQGVLRSQDYVPAMNQAILLRSRLEWSRLVAVNQISYLPSGTSIKVLAIELPPRGDAGLGVAKVSVLEGPYRDKEFYTQLFSINQLVTGDVVAAAVKAEERRAQVEHEELLKTLMTREKAAQSRSADSYLRSGLNLEKLSNFRGAIPFYRKVLKDFPDSKQAKEAAERIKVLERLLK